MLLEDVASLFKLYEVTYRLQSTQCRDPQLPEFAGNLSMAAVQAAGTIHTDFERGFICAEVMSYVVLHELKTEVEVKAAGKFRQEGKNYVVQDGDIINFKFNVTSSAKK